VRQLLAFASRQTISPRALVLNDTIGGMLSMLHRLIGEEITLEWNPAPDLWNVILDPSQIDQVLVNLTVNARDAINGIGNISIRTSNETVALTDDVSASNVPEGQYVLLSVSDNGCGMDAETQAHIYEPFFTTKQKEVGTGLGLSTVYGIVKQNHGFIRVDSTPGQGTTFRIYLPRHLSEAQIDSRPAVIPEMPQNGSETLLLVEDEPALLRLTQTLIKRMGYSVLAACGPNEALQISAAYAGEIHLLMTDVVMPDMSGHELWKRLIQKRPGIKSLYISGYTANIIAHHGIIESDIHFLQKPFSKESLAAKLREVLSHPHT
jgi:CheY-like chemotaxis protein